MVNAGETCCELQLSGVVMPRNGPGAPRAVALITPNASEGTSALPRWLSGKESACKCGRRGSFPSLGRSSPWRRKWQPTPIFLPGESHGQRSLAGYSSWSSKESDTTEATKHSTEHKVRHMMFLLLCLTSLSMTISRSSHLTANGIISLFNG